MENLKQCSSKQNKKSGDTSANLISPNILVYSANKKSADEMESLLKIVLDCDRYTLYKVSKETIENNAWRGKAALVILLGNIGSLAPLFVKHLLDGGRIFAICSDFLHSVLPFIENGNQEEKIAEFTYENWKSIKMKHQILTNTHFSSSKHSIYSGHDLNVDVLISEESNTPTLISVKDSTNNGITILSQMQLETDPRDYLKSDGERSNDARIGITRRILSEDFQLTLPDLEKSNILCYTKGYFLGDLDHKMSAINKMCSENFIHKTCDLTMQYYPNFEEPTESPSVAYLPIYVDNHPENFSTEEYFDNLQTTHLGRLLIYSDVLSSTMDITKGPLIHGIGVVARRQLTGRGRGGNAWITPEGQAAITLQIWRKITPSLPLIQHIAALAAVLAVRTPPYEHLNLRIKWPNDIYYGREVKIGGVVTTADCNVDNVIINVGTGVNISNGVPTTCVNDIIMDYNNKHKINLPRISIEYFIARYCTEMEKILNWIETDEGIDDFQEEYYKYWLHDNEETRVKIESKLYPVKGVISGVDRAGWLLVRTEQGEVITVAPDGNTFDIMNGLVAPKI